MRPIPDERLMEAWDAVRDLGSQRAAAEHLGIHQSGVHERVAQACKRFSLKYPTETGNASRPFEVAPVPSVERSQADLIEHRIAESRRQRAHGEAAGLIQDKIRTAGPVGFFVMGDPHIDSPGTDFELLHAHVGIAARRSEYLFAGNIGDVRDNWIGRLSRLYTDTTISARETLKLMRWLFHDAGVSWLWLIRGNHDCWAGHNDPLDFIAKGAGGVAVDGEAGARIAFSHPNGAVTRLNARHDFPGKSIYNPLHALKRETLYGQRDHIIVAGHRHIGADAGDVHGDGAAFQMVRTSGYKVWDHYAHTLGLKAKPIHPSALIIVNPDLPDTSRARAWCCPTIEEGADYLDWLRRRYDGGKRSQPTTEPTKRNRGGNVRVRRGRRA